MKFGDFRKIPFDFGDGKIDLYVRCWGLAALFDTDDLFRAIALMIYAGAMPTAEETAVVRLPDRTHVYETTVGEMRCLCGVYVDHDDHADYMTIMYPALLVSWLMDLRREGLYDRVKNIE